MKTLEPGLAAHIASGVTTLCWCWRVQRQDGVVQGFTDHDRDVVFDGVTYEAASGFSASDMRDEIGLSVDNLEVNGALSSASIDEAALENGLYDDASVDIFRVNWQSPDQRVLMRSGSLGEVRRSGTAFSAEVRGLSHYLQQPQGRLYQYTCDADLGDGRCGIDLDDPAYKATAVVVSSEDRRRVELSGLSGFEIGFFARGTLSVVTGNNAGAVREIKSHGRHAGRDIITLWTALAMPLDVGDEGIVTAGCDKRIETCQARFGNVVNFRGFPDIPGSEILSRVGRRS